MEPKVMAVKAKKYEQKKKPSAKANAKAKAPPIINPRPQHYHFWRSDTKFNILPKEIFNPIIASHLTQMPKNMILRKKFIETEFPLRDPAPHIPAISQIDWTEWSSAKSYAIRGAVNTIVKYRFLFRILLHHMRVRKLTAVNTEDILTMEIPKRPVLIVDWQLRQKYVFEAYTLMKDITCRLMTNDGLFQNPQPPRNPLTNLPFTESQIISIWNSISLAGVAVSSVFALFRKARYNLRRFELENTTILKINALKRTLNDTSCYYYRERMIDFISFIYEEESVHCKIHMYRYCMTNYPNHPLLKQWASFCYKFYEADILFINMPTKLSSQKNAIIDLAVGLIDIEYKIEMLWENLD